MMEFAPAVAIIIPMKCFLSILALLLAIEQSVPAAPPTTSAPSQNVDVLIARLSHDDWKLRQQAQDDLVRLGPAVVDRLKQVVAQTQIEEVRSRAESALRLIEENQAIGVSMITMHLKRAHPRKAFAELARQARTTIRTEPATLWKELSWDPIDVDIDHRPFWDALRELCRKTNVTWQLMGEGQGISLCHEGEDLFAGPSVLSGPFLIVGSSITHTSTVMLGKTDNAMHDFSVQIYAYAEPKLRILPGSGTLTINQAIDEKGRSLVPSMDQTGEHFSDGFGNARNLTVPLSYADNGGKRIARLAVSTMFKLQLRSQIIEVPDILAVRNVKHQIAGWRLLVRQLQPIDQGQDHQYDLTISATCESDDTLDLNSLLNMGQTIRLLDARGKQLSQVEQEQVEGNSETETYRIRFAREGNEGEKIGPPARLVIELPIETRDVPVTFEFTDLPIP